MGGASVRGCPRRQPSFRCEVAQRIVFWHPLPNEQGPIKKGRSSRNALRPVDADRDLEHIDTRPRTLMFGCSPPPADAAVWGCLAAATVSAPAFHPVWGCTRRCPSGPAFQRWGQPRLVAPLVRGPDPRLPQEALVVGMPAHSSWSPRWRCPRRCWSFPPEPFPGFSSGCCCCCCCCICCCCHRCYGILLMDGGPVVVRIGP
jgi:hypothetical protein